ncbi:ferredoxin-2 [Quercus suber]|uniref:Ferredoxin-2 n=1 Tax=Quercus suber TaxID=58331 RepID=A0AAW0LBA1_QUESU
MALEPRIGVVKVALHEEFSAGERRLEDNDACSAECEVNIAKNWLNMLPPCTYDEEYILKRSSRAHVMNMHSRLACQVVLTPELQGMIVTIPKPQPWDIP